ncbi:hypothetical protein DXG01_003710 [Tephrocybe rancida]|nr:hypothetical protein DXG01_003710 [Tephrocybe rancida]
MLCIATGKLDSWICLLKDWDMTGNVCKNPTKKLLWDPQNMDKVMLLDLLEHWHLRETAHGCAKGTSVHALYARKAVDPAPSNGTTRLPQKSPTTSTFNLNTLMPFEERPGMSGNGASQPTHGGNSIVATHQSVDEFTNKHAGNWSLMATEGTITSGLVANQAESPHTQGVPSNNGRHARINAPGSGVHPGNEAANNDNASNMQVTPGDCGTHLQTPTTLTLRPDNHMPQHPVLKPSSDSGIEKGSQQYVQARADTTATLGAPGNLNVKQARPPQVNAELPELGFKSWDRSPEEWEQQGCS